MNWFRNKQNKVNVKSTDTLLTEVMSNGISLTIEELIQYQSKSSLIDLGAGKNLHGKMSGNYLSRSKGRGMEFDEVRHYQTGDDIRAIDWRVTARTGITHTKLFREEIERPVLIATDLNPSMHFGSQLLFKSVQASHLAALVAWHAKKRGDRIGGIVFSQQQHVELKPRSRKEGVLHYLHTLAQLHQHGFNAEPSDSASQDNRFYFEQNCGRLRQLAKPGSLVYLITDGYNINDEAIRHLGNVTRHCELVVCIITDPLELALPKSQHKLNVAVTDGIKKQQLILGDEKVANRYQEKAQQLQNNLQTQLEKVGARVLNFSSGSSLESQLKYGVASWIR